ncbi:hypothetical protein ALO_04693 [Acetonema longum DSM 6540]|uniref:Flagellar motor switch protein FliG n=1 Tax=Acetonema longum DSM 6540 TaxID=1009370 RepID=F7NFV5_9FIRM|nr:hypothetical protein ALO_04693 [Acetonema longum DSM 6540]
MTPLEKVAIFLVSIGLETGQRIIALMDTSEINAVVPQIRSLTEISPEMQGIVWDEFKELGYEAQMNPVETLTVIRFLFNGSRIRYPY